MKRATARNSRRVLCVFPRYSPSFGTFENAYPLMGNVRAFMPPQGILTIASYMPEHWEVRLIDENMRVAADADFAWADVVFMSGMHIQRSSINDINARAHAHGKLTVLGGPSVSGCPEYYPEVDILHIGELGDATDAIVARIDDFIERPMQQEQYEAKERLPLTEFPVPAYEKVEASRYFLGSVQFSSGCPYRCEFCDIPELYGRNPRLKSPEQVVAELDAMLKAGIMRSVYFVDDNFVGNRKAAKELLPHLIAWQKKNGFPIEFACEATLNITKSPDLLEMMREAYFTTVFCGIETPDPEALHAISKDQNNQVPILEAIATLNRYGMEVVSGIIVGLDSDTPETGDKILHFIEESNIPILTINLLQALPRTPLYRRLQDEHRLVDEPDRESNVRFVMDYDDVVSMWRRCFTTAYAPEAIYRRFAYNAVHTYPNRVKIPQEKRATPANLRFFVTIMFNLIVRVGLLSHYRRTFWKMAWPALRRLDFENLIHIAMVSHHLITFARDAGAGRQNASFYSTKLRLPVAQTS
ncbi:MAG TPA: B12-binding domain-containing radical SAM protein [Candidatus Acidoferrales bacterium]|nr:B12-binding domain-containing radical SAM protein [Candidatus Acidoferrales bacterium]